MKKVKNKLSPAVKKELIGLFGILVILCALLVFLLIPEKVPIEETEEDLSKIKVMLLNGCGYGGIANDVKDILLKNENSRLDIIAWQNVNRDMFIYDKSLIVVKRQDDKKLEYLMKETGIKRRIYATNENSIEDFQIILGKDYHHYFSQE